MQRRFELFAINPARTHAHAVIDPDRPFDPGSHRRELQRALQFLCERLVGRLAFIRANLPAVLAEAETVKTLGQFEQRNIADEATLAALARAAADGPHAGREGRHRAGKGQGMEAQGGLARLPTVTLTARTLYGDEDRDPRRA